ncbi:hypothetical protein [Flammeovirga aprica]|uniref:DUF3592 domain-containing protein n=1 Tax=Flammeovirga aprica JL-4 TaxID=694437 RepID=A0A7X9RV81_9BACT|nr:hypothetical protein [Flammeovirga aprica]NME69316.1 hypothetical protein [Flammeovirga aprica JL-4]
MVLTLNGIYGIIAIVSFLTAFFASYNTLRTFDLKAFLYLQNDISTGNGEIINVFYTNTIENGVPIYRYDYIFHSKMGDFNWSSYHKAGYYKVGDKVIIEYHNQKPHINRIKGVNHSGIDQLFILALIVTAFMLFINFWIGNNRINILSEGEITRAILLEKENTSNPKRWLKRMQLSYITSNCQIRQTSRFVLNQPSTTEYTLIYHKSKPKKTIIVEHLPWYIQEDVKDIYNLYSLTKQ